MASRSRDALVDVSISARDLFKAELARETRRGGGQQGPSGTSDRGTCSCSLQVVEGNIALGPCEKTSSDHMRQPSSAEAPWVTAYWIPSAVGIKHRTDWLAERLVRALRVARVREEWSISIRTERRRCGRDSEVVLGKEGHKKEAV